MKLRWMTRLLVAMACCVFLRVDHAAAAVSLEKVPAQGRQAWLLDLLKSLADADALDDPAQVGALLGVKFDKSVVTTSPSHMESFARRFERDEYTPVTPTWFVAGPPGYATTGNWRPDGHSGFMAGVDPVAKGGAVNFKYFESKRFGLPEDPGRPLAFDFVRDDTQVSILFYGLDRLTCITLGDLHKHFPGLVHMEGTDASAERYLYHAVSREDAGAVLSFTAPRQGECFTDASVLDFSAFGNRHLRAQAKLFRCIHQAATAFCAPHPSAALSAAFNTYARKQCGSLNTIFDAEPRTNQAPAEMPDYAGVPTGCRAGP